MGYIYRIWNFYDNKSYVGQTNKKDPRDRIDDHLYGSSNGSITVQRAILKYGIEKFRWEILVSDASVKSLNLLEIKYIRKFNAYTQGYNLTEGGKTLRGYKHSEESRRRMSISRMGKKHHYYGKQLTNEHRRKISENNLGYKHTDEAKQKMREAGLGRKLTNEAKRKIREAMIGNKHSVGKQNHLGSKHTKRTKKKMRIAAKTKWVRYRREREG